MKKTIIIAAAILLAAGGAQAERVNNNSKSSSKSKTSQSKRRSSQEEGRKFNFSYGISLATSNTKTETMTDGQGGQATMTRSASGFGVFVYPKYNVFAQEKFSISVGVPLTLAFSGSSDSRTGETTTSFLYDLPLMVDINGGVMNPANRYGENRFGYFGGLGVGIENTQANYEFVSNGYTGEYDSEPKAKSVGPNIHVGGVMRFGSQERPRFIGLRLSYKIGLNTDKFNYFTPSLFMNI